MKKKSNDDTNMPVGLMMSLAQHQNAMKTFSMLNDEKQKSVIRYVEDSTTGEEAKDRIQNAVSDLDKGSTGFIG